MREACDDVVKNLIAKRAVVEATSVPCRFVCNIVIVKKSLGGHRSVVNLKPLNRFVRYERFKMESFDSLRHLIRRGNWIVKIDLKYAYLTIPMHGSHRHLRFVWDGRLFEFSCLPFCLSCAPRVFTKILKPAVAWLRAQGIRLVIYLDDFIFFNENKEELIQQVNLPLDLLEVFGFFNKLGEVRNRFKTIIGLSGIF